MKATEEHLLKHIESMFPLRMVEDMIMMSGLLISLIIATWEEAPSYLKS
jgi:hypothetical protein